MVFSQTSHKTRNILKVVEINRLKFGKNQQVNSTGVSGEITDSMPSIATTSSAEVSRFYRTVLTKSEPEVKSEMYHDLDCELFQNLQWCGTSAEQGVAQSIDNSKAANTRALTTDTLHTPISPQGWDISDAISPSAQAYLNIQPSYPDSPNVESANFNMDYLNDDYVSNSSKVPFQEQFLDISTLPVFIGDLASESNIDTNTWLSTQPVWQYTNDIEYNKTLTDTNTLPFIDQDDSLDMKMVSVTPREVENNDVMITEFIINGNTSSNEVHKSDKEKDQQNGPKLSVDIFHRSQPWAGDTISTPEVLSFVEQLEEEKCPLLPSIAPAQEDLYTETIVLEKSPPPHIDYEPLSPKSEPHIDSDNDIKSDKRKRRHHDSEDSDETYTPYTEHTPRKYRKRKPTLPIKDMIRELEGSQQLPKARRGRPPKRRESTISTVSENSSISTHDFKYRELRDKNNEASKRSRMNRKLKELQMEQLVEELEESNKKLRVRAELLEDMTKKLRDAFMSVVTQKKN